MSSHIEVIKSGERLDPSLGGTGYLPPSSPSTSSELIADLKHAALIAPTLNTAVWKVKRESMRHPRRLTLGNGKRLGCRVVGGARHWWFVSVAVNEGLRALQATTSAKGGDNNNDTQESSVQPLKAELNS